MRAKSNHDKFSLLSDATALRALDDVIICFASGDTIADESRVDIVSSAPTASSIVQSMADSVRREQEYKKAQDLLVRICLLVDLKLPEVLLTHNGANADILLWINR